MHRLLAALLISFSLGLNGLQAAYADDGAPPEGKLPAANAPNPTDDGAAAADKKRGAKKEKVTRGGNEDTGKAPKVRTLGTKGKSKKVTDAGLGTRMASTMVGSFAGVPVAAARHTKAEYLNAVHDLIGDTDNKWLWAAATPLCVPAGVLSGVLQSLVWGPYNAWKFSADEPFSPETFSLGDAK